MALQVVVVDHCWHQNGATRHRQVKATGPARSFVAREQASDSSCRLLVRVNWVRLAQDLFADGNCWPQFSSRYYLGLAPLVDNVDGQFAQLPKTLPVRRAMTRMVNVWHTTSIRLASRIWGEYKRRQGRHSYDNSLPLPLPSFLFDSLNLPRL